MEALEFLAKIWHWILENQAIILTILGALAIIANVTPTDKDDKFIAGLGRVIKALFDFFIPNVKVEDVEIDDNGKKEKRLTTHNKSIWKKVVKEVGKKWINKRLNKAADWAKDKIGK